MLTQTWCATDMIFCHFRPFDPLNNPKTQNFEEIKKPGDITILHLRTTNDDYMMYGSRDIKHDI